MKLNHIRILPVIHHIDSQTTRTQVALALELGADGVFLISHYGDDPAYDGVADDATLMGLAKELKAKYPNKSIGINCLSWSPIKAATAAVGAGLDMIWADSMGVDSNGLTEEGLVLKQLSADHLSTLFFASVAFKYRPHEPDPVIAAQNARLAGFIPTTSGAATGDAPDIHKIISMSAGGTLAIASGMNPENIQQYAGHLSHILVATGISLDEHHIDPEKLDLFIKRVRSVS